MGNVNYSSEVATEEVKQEEKVETPLVEQPTPVATETTEATGE